MVLVMTSLSNHFDLSGMRQVWLYLGGKEYTSLGFVTLGPYKALPPHPGRTNRGRRYLGLRSASPR